MNQEYHFEILPSREEIYWQSVQERDARFNGIFVYGVRSTGIYCKPSCPSRRPKKENTKFFFNCESAEANRFRACLRCKPQSVSDLDEQVEMVLKICRALEVRADEMLSLDDLGAEIGVSPHHLQRTFKSITGITPRQYAEKLRLKNFKSSLKNGDDVTTALYEAGFGSSSRLYEKSSSQLGMTPATYRRGGKGMNISYAITDCYLGRLLVAATERGICAVSFGQDDEELASRLSAEYPAAVVLLDEELLIEWIRAVLDYLNNSQPDARLPLDLQATAFQVRVWEELRRIPYGETRSYSEIAKAIGQPTATRAVARACATNPVAVVTPCHRVIRENGDLGGYRWGLERKQKLLKRERETKSQYAE